MLLYYAIIDWFNVCSIFKSYVIAISDTLWVDRTAWQEPLQSTRMIPKASPAFAPRRLSKVGRQRPSFLNTWSENIARNIKQNKEQTRKENKATELI